jgi:hypothetical protein
MCRTTRLMCLGLLLGGCSRQTPVAPQAQLKAAPPVICRLVSRDQTITISKGAGGPVYSVQTAAGKTLLSYATLGELRDRHPDLARQLDSAIVADGPNLSQR